MSRLGWLLLGSVLLLGGEWGLDRYISRHSWLGYGIPEFPLQSFTEERWLRMIRQVDMELVRWYAAFQVLDCVFCFFYSMLLCDVITLLLGQAVSPSNGLRWLDLVPFVVAFLDFLENSALLGILLSHPIRGDSVFWLPLASRLSQTKQCGILLVFTVVLLSALLSLAIHVQRKPALRSKND